MVPSDGVMFNVCIDTLTTYDYPKHHIMDLYKDLYKDPL